MHAEIKKTASLDSKTNDLNIFQFFVDGNLGSATNSLGM